MVDATDIKFYRSINGSGSSLGGDIDTASQLTSGTENNFFTNASYTLTVDGADEYKCFYIKNTSAEKIRNVSIWQAADTSSSRTTVQWALDLASNPYRYHPYETFNGSSDFQEIASSTGFNEAHFSVACWFRTSTNFSNTAYLVCKGKDGSELSADNFAFVLYMNSSEQIVGGFEESGGTDHLATSASSYNDDEWHLAVVTYNGTTVKLYIDGSEVATHSTTTTPNTNSHPVRIGSDSVGTASRFFDGDIDEVRLWETSLDPTEISDLYSSGEIPATEDIIFFENNGSNNGTRIAQEIPDINTEPTGLDWQQVISQPTTANIHDLGTNGYVPIWLWWHLNSSANGYTLQDRTVFNFQFNITTSGTGSGGQTGGGGGTGSGGNPPPSVSSDYKIAVVGDWGEENATDDVVALIKDNDYDLVISTGDQSYTSSDSSWYSSVIKDIDDNQGSSIQFEGACGNHDSASDIKKHFGYKNAYTSFDFQNTHTLILDTEESMTGAQLSFAQTDLDSASKNSNIDWIFVAFHRPAIGPDSDHANNEESQVQNYFDLFKQKGVNFVFQGHNHIWFRSYPVKRSGSSAVKVVSSSGPYTTGTPEDWFIVVTSGTGGHDSGKSLYSLDSTPPFSAYQNRTNNGIFSLVASNSGQTLTCKFINTDNQVKHSFVVNKG